MTGERRTVDGMTLLDVRRKIEDSVNKIEGLGVMGSGQTLGQEPVGDITFGLGGRTYKLVLMVTR